MITTACDRPSSAFHVPLALVYNLLADNGPAAIAVAVLRVRVQYIYLAYDLDPVLRLPEPRG